ncbi:MAG: O-methyltransferase [Candidatus Limnocylindria bacterium]
MSRSGGEPDERWTQVDEYVAGQLIGPDPEQDAALAASDRAGLLAIQVSAPLGKLLYLLATMTGARRILEVGTLGGYSATWLARALPPDGRLVTLELDRKHADVATANLARAGLASVAEVRVGPAADTLAKLAAEGQGPFDLVFIDADKPGYPTYLEWALKLSRKGTVLVFDNMVRGGRIADATSEDESVRATRRTYERIAKEKRLSATAIQTVGTKGYDGFVLAVVTAAAS